MTIGNLPSDLPNSVQRQELFLQASLKRSIPRNSSLVSRGSTDSITSYASSTTAETTESDSVSSSGRRSIFSDYWKNSPLPSIPCQDLQEEDGDEDDDQPRSPLLEHYPTRKGPSDSTGASMACTASPARRSIFSRTKSNSMGTVYNSHQDKLDLEYFFSKHEHMKVLSSSLQRRERSYSCSDASVEKSKGPLSSCLKRRALSAKDSKTPAERRPSVTFDSQIEIVAFQPTTSFEEAPSCRDGSWTNLFQL